MMTAALPLDNQIQHAEWGSRTALSQLFGLDNQDQAPQAEIWIGAHQRVPSVAVFETGERRPLDGLLAEDPSGLLGTMLADRFQGKLPFMLKVVSAARPLSLQVHPGKTNAERGYAAEQQAGIPLDAPERNYPDENHKPELFYALTPLRVLNGFRPLEKMMDSLLEIDHPLVLAQFRQLKAKREAALKPLLHTLLTLKGAERAGVITKTLEAASRLGNSDPAFAEMINLQRYYPNDMGILAPLLLNIVELQPGEAMYLAPETPHVYLEGTSLGMMACSENVLRCGLTSRHIDVEELLGNIRFEVTPFLQLICEPRVKGNYRHFPLPVDDFSFGIWELLPDGDVQVSPESAEILFCVKGEVRVTSAARELCLKSGQSCFIAASVGAYQLDGEGVVARVYNERGPAPEL